MSSMPAIEFRDALQGEDGMELRALRTEDAAAIYALVDRNRPHLRRWLPWVDTSHSAEDTLRFLLSVEEGRRQRRTIGYRILEHGALRGIVGAHDIDEKEGHAAIGYWLAEDAAGRGLMTRAVRLLLAVLFEELRLERVEIRCAVGNRPSCAVAERLGFQFEGILRRAQRLQEEFADMRVYSLLAAEWRDLGGGAD